jgi:peptidoglycan-N-acetylglucosamine deacetylase
MENALTIDVEEWYHLCGPDPLPEPEGRDRRVVKNTRAILALLHEFGIKATFFVLGSLAEEEPDLAPLIAEGGHEIASHGWSHRLVTTLEPEEFRGELRRTGELLEKQCGRRPVGFRAPQWSLGSSTPWAYEILREEGYRYDSSLNPLPFVGDRRGARVPHQTAGALLEFPPLVTPFPGMNLPTGGGWGLRFFPRSFAMGSIRALNDQGYPALLYLHPREMDPDGPRVKLSPFREFVAYGPRRSAAEVLRPILSRYRFTTLERLTDLWDTASSFRHTMPPQPSLP